MHKSWGNAIWFDDAVERMGADVMRWLFAGQPPAQNMNFGYGPANDVKRRLLTLWNALRFFVQYAAGRRLRAALRRPRGGPGRRRRRSTAGSSRARRRRSRTRARALDAYATPAYTAAVEAYVDDLSNWYIRGSRARFWREADDADKQAAFRTLWYCLVQTLRLVAPAMPFLAEEIWQTIVARRLRRRAGVGAPRRLPGGRRGARRRGRSSTRSAATQPGDRPRPHRAGAGRPAALEAAPAARGRGRRRAGRPARRRCAAHAAEIAAELNVKEVRVVDDASDARHGRARPELPRARPAPRQGRAGGQASCSPRVTTRSSTASCAWASGSSREGEYEERVSPRRGPRRRARGRARGRRRDGALDDGLVDEGIARDLVHQLQAMRKDARPRDHGPHPRRLDAATTAAEPRARRARRLRRARDARGRARPRRRDRRQRGGASPARAPSGASRSPGPDPRAGVSP